MEMLAYIVGAALQLFAYGIMIIGTVLIVVMAVSVCLLAIMSVVSLFSWLLSLFGVRLKFEFLGKFFRRGIGEH